MPHILKRIAGAAVSAVILAGLFFFWLIPLCAVAQDSILPFYRVSVDIQKPQEQFFIDRTFYGNQAFLAFDIFDGNDAQEQPLAWTNTANWTFNVSYAYDQYETGKYYIAQSSISSNRVYFLGATNLWFSPRDNYFVELIGTHASGYVKTFGQGFMNQDFSPGADSNVTVQMGAYNLTWWTNNVGQLAASNAARIAAIETSQWTTIRTILTNTTWSATIVTQQLVLQIVTNAPGSGVSTGIVALTIGGGLLSSTNTSMGTVIDVTLTTNAVQIAMSGLFLTYTQGFGGDLTGPFSNMQIAAGVISTTELDTNVNARLSEASAAYAWGSWSQGIYGASSDFYLNTNGTPQIRTSAVTTVEILDGTIGSVDLASNAIPLGTFTNPDGHISTNSAALTFFPTNGGLGGDLYGTPTNALIRTNAVGSAEVTDGTITTGDVTIAQWDAKYLNVAGDTSGYLDVSASLNVSGGDIIVTNGTSGSTKYGWGVFVDATNSSDYIGFRAFWGTSYANQGPMLWMRHGGINGGIGVSSNANDGTQLSRVNVASGAFYTLWDIGNDGAGSGLDADLIDGLDSTNFVLRTNFNAFVDSAVTTTTIAPQRVQTKFLVGDSLYIATNFMVASTNGNMSSNMLVNGNFTGDTAWVLSGGLSQNSGSTGILVCAAGTTGSAIPSNRFAATPGTWVFRYVNLVPPSTGSITVSFGGKTNTVAGNLTGRVEHVFYPHTTQTFEFAMNSTNGLISVDEFELFHQHDGDAGIGRDLSVGRTVSASNLFVSGTISGNATGYVPLVGSSVITGNLTVAGILAATLSDFYIYDASDFTRFEQNGPDLWIHTTSGQIYQNGTNLVWHAANDGIGSGLDAGLVEGVDMLTNGLLKVTVAATNPAAADGLALVKRGTNFSLEVPASASTGSVGGISHTGSVAGTILFSDSTEINVDQTNDTFSWSIVSGSIASSKLASAIWTVINSKGTGSVGVVASFGVTNTAAGVPSGTWPNINIGTNDSLGSATGNVFSVTSTAPWLVVSSRYGPEVVLAPTSTPLFSEANTPTNAFTPTSLAVGAGDTCIVVRTGANLFSLVATSTPTTITFDSTWTTGHVGTCLIELYAGTNSIAFPTSVVHNVGRASSTNLQIQTTGVTELMFQKPIGSIWRVIQLTP